MNCFRRQQLRGLAVTVLTALLLVGAMAFTVIGYAASETSYRQAEAIDARYLTVGMLMEQENRRMVDPGWYVEPDDPRDSNGRVWLEKNYTRTEDGSIQWDDGTVFHGSTQLEAVAAGAPQIRSLNHSAILSARVKGVYGLSSGQLNKTAYNESFEKNGVNFAVVAVNMLVHNLPDHLPNTAYRETVIDRSGGKSFLRSLGGMQVSSIVSAHPFYRQELQNKLSGNRAFFKDRTTNLSLYRADGTKAMEEGKSYLYRCFISDAPILLGRTRDGVYTYFQYTPKLTDYVTFLEADRLQKRGFGFSETLAPTTPALNRHETLADTAGSGPENFTLEVGARPWGIAASTYYDYFYTVPQDSLPYYAEFTGTVDEFLASEEGRVWREEIIPMAEMNQQSATVVLTDHLDYIAGFSSGEAYLVDGRKLEPVEYKNGAQVCLISAAYAEANGLSVGDSLTLDFHDTGYYLTSGAVELISGTTYGLTVSHDPLQPSNRIGYEAEYEIVGIYAAPEWEFGVQTFHADTIFVPKASVPDAEKYEDPALPLLNSITILNGSAEQFEAYMQSQGFGGYYTFYDHDYSSNIAGFEAMGLNATRLLLIGLVVLTVTAVLFYYLNFRRMRAPAGTMRRLGQSRFLVWWQMVSASVPLIWLSVLAGAAAGVYSFDIVTRQLLQTGVVLDLQIVKQITLAEAILLTVPAVLIPIPIAMPNMMKH